METKGSIAHNWAQIVLLVIWISSLCISCILVASVIFEIDSVKGELAEFGIVPNDPDCESDFTSHEDGAVRLGIGKLQDRGVYEQHFCGDIYAGSIIQNYLLPITSFYLPVLVIMIASVIRETESTKGLPISMQKFGFALVGFLIAQVIVLGSVFGALNGDVISFNSAEFQIVSASIVNTLMMLAITLCFPEYRSGQKLVTEAGDAHKAITKAGD